MARRKQGYNARLDESLGERNRGSKSQSLKSRRDESKGTEKSMGKRAYSAVGTMDKGSRGKSRSSSKRVVNLGAGGPVGGSKSSRNSALTPQHKRLAMGQSVAQGPTEVKGYQYGGAIGRSAAAVGPDAARRSTAAKKIADKKIAATRAAAAKRQAERRKRMDAGTVAGENPRDLPKSPRGMRGGGAVKKMKRGSSPGRRGR